jgi:hypothetical protein
MSDHVDRSESTKGTRDNPGYYAGASPACFFATTNPIDIAYTPIQPIITFATITIQFSSREVRLRVCTSFYACYAFTHDTITYPGTSYEVTNAFHPVSYSVYSVPYTNYPVIYTGSSNAPCDAWTNFPAVANSCATSHPSQAPQTFYPIPS